MQLLFYTNQLTPRVEYIVATLFKAIGILDYTITDNKTTYISSALPKVNYSNSRLTEDEVRIAPARLLFESDISEQKISCFNWNNNKAFYKTEGDFLFDIFAASFYLITRYEEYLLHDLDEYGRYGHKNSLAYKEDFLHLPLINTWLNKFSSLISSKYSSLFLIPQPFKFIPTYDVDIAWNYLNKGIVRNVGGALKSLFKGDLKAVIERVDVKNNKKQDPFDIYGWLNELHQEYNLEPIYFFLLAATRKGYDKNIDPGNRFFRNLIRNIASKYVVGIHPSWQSGDDKRLLTEEIETLKEIIEREVGYSRQHYIRMSLPTTYRTLIDAGIKEDYSMGYGSINGFRASYCLPFQWYDLSKETTTNLTIYPFCYMEANSYFEQKYTLQQAKEELGHYYKITKEVSGILITIFHNHLLGNKQDFKGWKEMYEEFIRTKFQKDK